MFNFRLILVSTLFCFVLGCAGLQVSNPRHQVTGYVLHVEDDFIMVDLGKEHLKNGQLIHIFTVHKTVIHPVTNKLASVGLEPLGTAVISGVGDDSSSGTIMSRSGEIAKGCFIRKVVKKNVPKQPWWEEANKWSGDSSKAYLDNVSNRNEVSRLQKEVEALKGQLGKTIPKQKDKLVEQSENPIHVVPQNSVIRKEITWKKDGSKMVMIPAGSFEMGDHFDEGSASERPVHIVTLDAFYMDAYEVTVGQYKEFIRQTDHHRGLPHDVSQWSPTYNHPVMGVSWYDARAYCLWAGKRLPTEAEWEYAARGGLKGKRYPWGNTEPDGRQCNYADRDEEVVVDDGYARCAPVGSYPPNRYGLYDMAGNVSEWCWDWYDSNYYSLLAKKNPKGLTTSGRRVLRGGAWMSPTSHLRVANRDFGSHPPDDPHKDTGFRCVSDVR